MVSDMELTLILKLLVAALLGFMVGIERKGGIKGAGSRTFMLITIGCTAFTVLSVEGFTNNTEPSRLAAQIISGDGFIGAGVIWKADKDEGLHGLTTAAAIWVAAAMGIAIGLGYFYSALVMTMLMMFILAKGHPVEHAKENLGMIHHCADEKA